MKLFYFNLAWGDIVVCDAPVGSMCFNTHATPPQWLMLTPRTPEHPTWVHIVAFTDEIEDTQEAFKKALQKAFQCLLPSKQKRGVMGVILKETYKAEGKIFRQIGFFHIPSLKAWNNLFPNQGQWKQDEFPPPPGYPSKV